MKQHKQRERNRFLVNRQIRAPQVICIDQDERNCGVIPIAAALNKASEAGLDLVMIAQSGPAPTCKIVDFSRFKYEQSKKERLQRKHQRENTAKVKEIKFRPSTGENDLRIKAKQAQEFIDEGHKLKITMFFKGRELQHREVANETLQQFLQMLPNVELTSEPIMTGKTLSVMAMRKHVENRSREVSIAS